ncbi:MAG: ornithine cyclodeaminase family protein [Deltaproteobacteria bacterium]|nr:ornithine cyclodeaminase family protein [Deltaproteobacteria bacterium]MBI2538262.1 ornithine cyclodeaminase family protein [Deltaproteobacteria bacterium]MBI3061763.1 ornithine cyclodeaminase family protein [Deltaproteobacteria bacterium]
MLVLSEREIQSLIDVEGLSEALEKAHVEFSTGKAVMPVRLVVPVPEIKGRITSMPAYLSEDKALGMKVVTYFPENPRQGLPIILATVFLFSTESGKLLAVMDGTYITAIRTACISAVATRALANPETPVLGVLGAGVQARAQIRTLCAMRKIEEIKVYDVLEKSVRSLKEELEPDVGIKIEAVKSAEEAVRDVDLLVTVTTAKEPIVRADWLKPGVHISAIGSHRPDLREIDGVTMRRAKVVVDSREAVMAECGDVLLAIKEGAITEDHIHAEIGEVLAGKKTGRTSAGEITLYKAVGIAIQDVAAAKLVYRTAVEKKVGVNVEL